MFGSEDLFEFSFKYVDPKTRKITFNPKTGGKTWQDWEHQDLAHEINKMLGWKFDSKLVDSFELDA